MPINTPVESTFRCWLMNAAKRAAPTPPGMAEKMMETTPSSFLVLALISS